MVVRYNEVPFNLIGKSGKWSEKDINGKNKYLNKYEGTIINDKLWVIGVPHLNDENEKKDGTKYRLYTKDYFSGEFIVGLIVDDYIIGSVNSDWADEVFNFQNDEEPEKVKEIEKKWIDDGCLVAIKARGNNMEKLVKDFNNHLFTDELCILSESDDETYEIFKANYELFKQDYTKVSHAQIKFLKQQGLYLNIIEDINDIEDKFDGFKTKQDFIDITELVDEFKDNIDKIFETSKAKSSSNSNGSSRNYSYNPPQKLKFIKEQLKDCGFEGETIKDMINFGKQNKEQWFMFVTVLGISGSYMPRYEFPFDIGNDYSNTTKNDKTTNIVEFTEQMYEDQIDDTSLIELETDNNNNGNIDLSKHKGIMVIEDLLKIPGQIPKDFDINNAIINGDINEKWLDTIYELNEIIDLTERSIKLKLKRIKPTAKTIVDLNNDELIELKNRLA